MTHIERFNHVPPILCRLLAREDGRVLSDEEIALHPLTPSRVRWLGWQTDWSSVTVPEAFAFLSGCRVNLLDAGQWHVTRGYLHRPNKKFTWLRQDPEWSRRWQPMLEHWIESNLKK